MSVVFTEDALRELDEALDFIAANYPGVSEPFQSRIRSIVSRIGDWPSSAQKVEGRPGVFVVPLIRYPYKLFYQVRSGTVEVLHVSHTARE